MKTLTFIFNGRLFSTETRVHSPEDLLKNFFNTVDYLKIDDTILKDRFNGSGFLVEAALENANLRTEIGFELLATDTRESYDVKIGQSVVIVGSDKIWTVIDILDLPTKAVKLSNNSNVIIIKSVYDTRPATSLECAAGGKLTHIDWI